MPNTDHAIYIWIHFAHLQIVHCNQKPLADVGGLIIDTRLPPRSIRNPSIEIGNKGQTKKTFGFVVRCCGSQHCQHPGNLTWIPKMMVCKSHLLFTWLCWVSIRQISGALSLTRLTSPLSIIEPRKKPSYFPLYWMVNRDPYNGLL